MIGHHKEYGKNLPALSVFAIGHVRGTYSLNSDSPDMAQAAREQVMKRSFQPAVNKGEPVQVESILTFRYHASTFPEQK
jgi:hypothetical protein